MPLLHELSPEQQIFVTSVSVFDRPIAMTSLRRLFPESNVDTMVYDLVDRFILDYTHENSLQMHALIRGFCYSLLSDSQAKHKWAADFYMEECNEVDDPEVLTDAQIDALLAGWSHFVHAGDHALATEVIGRLRAPLINRGRYDQVLLLLEKTTPATAEDEDWFAITRARILSLNGMKEQALDLVRPLVKTTDLRVAREAILVLSLIYNDHGLAEQAIELLEAELKRFSGSIAARIKRRFLLRLVQAHLLKGNAEEAYQWASRIAQASETDDDKVGGATALRQMATSMQLQGHLELALSLCQMSQDIFLELRRAREAALSQVRTAQIYRGMGNQASAEEQFRQALKVFRDLGDRVNSRLCREQLSNYPA